VIHPGIQFKPVKCNPLLPNRNYHQTGPYLSVKAVSVHAQIEGRVPEADQSWSDRAVLFHEPLYDIAFNQIVDRNPGTAQKRVQKRDSRSELSNIFIGISNGKLALP